MCSASKLLKCIVVTVDLPMGITLRSDCLYDRQSGGKRVREVRRERHNGREDMWRGRKKREVFKWGVKIESQTSSRGELAFYLVAVECKATDILPSPLETAVFPFFKDIFSLFIGSLRRDPSLSSDTGFLL